MMARDHSMIEVDGPSIMTTGWRRGALQAGTLDDLNLNLGKAKRDCARPWDR